MDIEATTDHLERLYRAGKRFPFLLGAGTALARAPQAPRLAALMAAALADCGLGGPLRELIHLREDLAGGAQAKALQAAALRLPNGRLKWVQRRDILDANSAALQHRGGELRAVLEASAQLVEDLHLYTAGEGRLHLSRRKPGQHREWLADLSSHPDAADLDLPPADQVHALLVTGLPGAALLEKIYNATHRVFLSSGRPVFLVEPDEARFAAWLHSAPMASWLADERIHLLIGPQALDELFGILEQNPNLAIPNQLLNCRADTALFAAAHTMVQQIGQQRAAELEHLGQDLMERYADRDVAYWARRFDPPGQVLGLTSRFTTMLQYSARDALEAFSHRGYTTRMLIEANDHEMLSPITVCRAVLEQDPVAVLLLDHLRYELPDLPANLPVFTWIQDPMSNLLCQAAGASIGPLDFVCGHYHHECTQQYGYPATQFEPVEMPVSTRVFHAGPFPPAEQAGYACEVSFVSNASMPIARFFEDFRERHPASMHPLLDGIYECVRAVLSQGLYLSFHETAAELVRAVADDCRIMLSPEDVVQIKNKLVYRLFDWGRRQQTLEWVADWVRQTGRRLRIYGRGWDEHPTLAPFAAGVIEHGEPLRRANAASALGLQLIATGFRHQRSYELIRCGTLPLTRYAQADFAYLEVDAYHRRREAGESLPCSASQFPGFERIVFATPQQFAERAERFLADTAYREAVLAEFQQIVERDLTYDAVIAKVERAFRERVLQPAMAGTPSEPTGR